MTNPTVKALGEKQYLQGVQAEIAKVSAYSARQIRRHRWSAVVVVVAGASVPVLAAWDVIPTVVLGALGAVAAASGGIAQIMQWQSSGVTAMKVSNALERELNLFLMVAGPYATSRTFEMFVERIEAIRDVADQGFLETWQRGTAQVEGSQPVQAVESGQTAT
ncbi:Protein of unknown function [Asanoa hainanensis]|uniref:Uncharacterized protein n=1 Tax=Asanoa hainanensis TaxID=560556 RepID=A0A239PFW2_9ACTN|nr:DUF4231 domain-containing protein [Asanoa hainanensis]SNT65880.1 Protein of unknown function [Asanoa hainanensis]